jgi:hypothetical protein
MWWILGAALLGSSSAEEPPGMKGGGPLTPIFVEQSSVERIIDPSLIRISWTDDFTTGTIASQAKSRGIKGCLLGAAIRIRADKHERYTSIWFVWTSCDNLKGGIGKRIGFPEESTRPTLR